MRDVVLFCFAATLFQRRQLRIELDEISSIARDLEDAWAVHASTLDLKARDTAWNHLVTLKLLGDPKFIW